MSTRTGLLLLALTGLLMTTEPAVASCVAPPPVDEGFALAGAVFSGTVESIDFDGRLATVNVDIVWKGDVAARVDVQGTSELTPNAGTSVDRSYQPGEWMVFFVEPGGVGFVDNACTLTQVLDPDLVAVLDEINGGPGQPAATGPESDGVPPTRMNTLIVGGVGLLVAAAGAGLLVAGRRHRIPETEGFRSGSRP